MSNCPVERDYLESSAAQVTPEQDKAQWNALAARVRLRDKAPELLAVLKALLDLCCQSHEMNRPCDIPQHVNASRLIKQIEGGQ